MHVKALLELIVILLVASIPQFAMLKLFDGFINLDVQDSVFLYFTYLAFIFFYLIFIIHKSGLFFNQVYKTPMFKKIIIVWFIFTGLFLCLIAYSTAEMLLNFPEGNMYLSLRPPLLLMGGLFYFALAYKLTNRARQLIH
jgi:hypothetical protein